MRICEERKPESESACRDLQVSKKSRRAYSLGEAFVDVLNALLEEARLYWPTLRRHDKLLNEYFEIDEKKLENERRAILDACREANEKANTQT